MAWETTASECRSEKEEPGVETAWETTKEYRSGEMESRRRGMWRIALKCV